MLKLTEHMHFVPWHVYVSSANRMSLYPCESIFQNYQCNSCLLALDILMYRGLYLGCLLANMLLKAVLQEEPTNSLMDAIAIGSEAVGH
jgi:hypothetical protein